MLALAGILGMSTAPTLQYLTAQYSVAVAAQALTRDIAFARSSALARSQRVYICTSSDARSCAAGTDWSQGWIVATAIETQGKISVRSVLRVQQAVGGVTSMRSAGVGVKPFIRFEASGWAKAAAASVSVQAQVSGGVVARQVVISMNGRASVRRSLL